MVQVIPKYPERRQGKNFSVRRRYEIPSLISFLITALTAEWVQLADLPEPANAGAALIYGKDDWIYAFRGSGSRDFYYYDISENRWYSAPPAPAPVGPGGCLTSNWYCLPGAYMEPATHIWALRGGNTTDFWRFDLATNRWETLPPIPEPVQYGASLAYGSDEVNSYWVYAIIGGESHSFYKYGPVAPPGGWPVGYKPEALPRWVRMERDLPLRARPGASITVEDAMLSGRLLDSLFYNPAIGRHHYSYFIPTGPWNPAPPFPLAWDSIGPGSSMISTRYIRFRHEIYVLQGANSKRCARRMLGETRWSNLSTRGFENVKDGGALAFGPDRIVYAYLYALIGGNRRNFYRTYPWPTDVIESEEGGMAAMISPFHFKFTVRLNPLTGTAKITFRLPEASEVSLTMYDATGRMIRKIFSGNLQVSDYTFTWDGKDASGRKVAPGIYFLKLKTDKTRITEKMVIK